MDGGSVPIARRGWERVGVRGSRLGKRPEKGYLRPMTDLVLTLLGPDRPGLVELVAGVIAAHGGNWLESRMSHLAGKFAGILRAELPGGRGAAATAARAALEARGPKVSVVTAARAGPAAVGRSMELELAGLGRP